MTLNLAGRYFEGKCHSIWEYRNERTEKIYRAHFVTNCDEAGLISITKLVHHVEDGAAVKGFQDNERSQCE